MKLTSLLLWGAAALALPGTLSAQSVLNVDYELGMDDGEITPDGRYGVVRMNGYQGTMRVYDMATGALVERHQCDPNMFGPFGGANEDGVAVTNERAIMIGNCALIGDLTAVGTPGFLLGNHYVGQRARDVAITPDGTIAAVRGGHVATGGGLFLFDLQTGAQLVNAPGDPSNYFSSLYSSSLDSVAVTNQFAVFTSLASDTPPTTRVTIFALRTDSGVPAIAYETVAAAGPDQDLQGAPSDLAITPDGRYVALRSEFEVALFRLRAAGPGPVWRKPPLANPGGLGNATMDTIAVTDTRIATITRWSNGGVGAQVDVFDLAGNQAADRIVGDPHDLAITPSGERLIVRTSSGAALYDLGARPAGGNLPQLDSAVAMSTHTGWSAGLDSIEVSRKRAAMLFRTGTSTDVRVFDISADTLNQVGRFTLPDEPTDLALTPNGRRLVVTGLHHLQVFDLRTNTLMLDHDVPGNLGYVPWSDGTVADDARALTWGVNGDQLGWVAVVDLLPPAP